MDESKEIKTWKVKNKGKGTYGKPYIPTYIHTNTRVRTHARARIDIHAHTHAHTLRNVFKHDCKTDSNVRHKGTPRVHGRLSCRPLPVCHYVNVFGSQRYAILQA